MVSTTSSNLKWVYLLTLLAPQTMKPWSVLRDLVEVCIVCDMDSRSFSSHLVASNQFLVK